MTYGPIDFLALEFEGNKFRGDILPTLLELIEQPGSLGNMLAIRKKRVFFEQDFVGFLESVGQEIPFNRVAFILCIVEEFPGEHVHIKIQGLVDAGHFAPTPEAIFRV